MLAKVRKHVDEITKSSGQRIELFDLVGITEGWVVSLNVPRGFWNKCRVCAIPLEPSRLSDGAISPAMREMDYWVKENGKDIMVVLIPDDETIEGYSWGPMLIGDLKEDPEELLTDYIIACPLELSIMKRRCAMILLGWADTQ